MGFDVGFDAGFDAGFDGGGSMRGSMWGSMWGSMGFSDALYGSHVWSESSRNKSLLAAPTALPTHVHTSGFTPCAS